jgi:hypothetical protein
MVKPRKTGGPNQGDGEHDRADAALSMEALGEELLREARAGQAAYVAGWQEFMEQVGVRGEPVDARQLREILVRQGINPENNEFSRGIIAMREE